MLLVLFFFFNDTATSVIYTLSLHDALPISFQQFALVGHERGPGARWAGLAGYQIVASGFPQHARVREAYQARARGIAGAIVVDSPLDGAHVEHQAALEIPLEGLDVVVPQWRRYRGHVRELEPRFERAHQTLLHT